MEQDGCCEQLHIMMCLHLAILPSSTFMRQEDRRFDTNSPAFCAFREKFVFEKLPFLGGDTAKGVDVLSILAGGEDDKRL
jgi:hypothetical protein